MFFNFSFLFFLYRANPLNNRGNNSSGMSPDLQYRAKRAQNEILKQSVVRKIIMELYYGTIKPKEYRQYRTERKMDVLSIKYSIF